jgi:hypothetical protein
VIPFRVLESIVSFVKLGIAARGRVAQLGERIVRNDEVAGSTPVSSTNVSKYLRNVIFGEKSALCPDCALTSLSAVFFEHFALGG